MIPRFAIQLMFSVFALGALAPLCLADESREATSEQIWANFIIGRPFSEKLYFEYDFEGAKQISGGEPWRSLYGTALVEYYPNSFIDLTGELVTGVTKQTQDERSFEIAGRAGIRLHLISQIFNSHYLDAIRPERLSGKRFSIANLMRLEKRNFHYSGNLPSTSDTRFRNRAEFKYALNRDNLAEDGVWNLLMDIEWFVPLDDEAPERFATKRRFRLGLGYRKSYHWRYDCLLMWDDTRDTIDGEVEREALMIDFRFKMYL